MPLRGRTTDSPLMPESTDSPNADLPGALREVVKSLDAGRPVRLSDGRRSALIVNATREPADDVLAAAGSGRPGVLLLRDAAAALDFLDRPSLLAKRLMRRCWPGPVRLQFARDVDDSLLSHLADSVRRSGERDQGLTMSVPESSDLQQILQCIGYPLVKLELQRPAEPAVESLTELSTDPDAVADEAEIRVDGDRWELVVANGLTEEDVAQMSIARILFVCTGNTCRSPMAEGMFRRLLAERLHCPESDLPQRGFEVASAGLSACEGAPASPESVEICRAWGVDLSGHLSQPLTESLLEKSDLILTMTSEHRDAILSRYPELESEVQLLSPTGADVSDPIGWGPAAYVECHQEIVEGLQALVDELAPSP